MRSAELFPPKKELFGTETAGGLTNSIIYEPSKGSLPQYYASVPKIATEVHSLESLHKRANVLQLLMRRCIFKPSLSGTFRFVDKRSLVRLGTLAGLMSLTTPAVRIRKASIDWADLKRFDEWVTETASPAIDPSHHANSATFKRRQSSSQTFDNAADKLATTQQTSLPRMKKRNKLLISKATKPHYEVSP